MQPVEVTSCIPHFNAAPCIPEAPTVFGCLRTRSKAVAYALRSSLVEVKPPDRWSQSMEAAGIEPASVAAARRSLQA